MPISSYGDLFRWLPGFNVDNYGQGAVGYGLSLRGYTDGEHGRDIAYYIDGVPMNEVSSLHTPNYADLNWLFPETIRSFSVVRGPFSVECGDSNLGGCITIATKRSEPFATASISGGSFGTVRGVGTYSSQGGSFEPFLAQEGYVTNGYRDNSFINRYDSFNKITLPFANGDVVSFRAQAYGTTYGAPGYANRDAVRAGLLSPRSATNQTDGGYKYLENFVTNYVSGPADQELSAVAYAINNQASRYADFGGGQRVQHEDRTFMGGQVRKVWTGAFADRLPVQVLAGGYWRTDFLDTMQAPTTARTVTGTPVNSMHIDQTNLAGYTQVQIKPIDWLKLVGGVRYDQFFYDIDNKLDPTTSTTLSPGVWQPKAGVAVTPFDWLELYGNYGQGFRSIDAALEVIGNPGVKPFKIESKEVGIQFQFSRFRFQADAWTTDSENESFQAAPGLPVTFLGAARRDGFDLDGRFYFLRDPVNTVWIFANYGYVRARLLDAAPSFYVPQVPDYVANVGIEYDVATWNGQRLSGSAYVTFTGKKHLSQDNSQLTEPYQRITGRLAYTWPEGWTAWGQATWYPGDLLSEATFNFGDVVNTASADIVTSPVARLNVMAGLTYRMPTPNYGPMPTTKLVVK